MTDIKQRAKWTGHRVIMGVLDTLNVPLVLGLTVVSGYTTSFGMYEYLRNWIIAGILTTAFQTVNVRTSYEMAGIRPLARPGRWLLLLVLLTFSLTVSIYFSYITFYRIEHDLTKLPEQYQILSDKLGKTRANFFEAKKRIINQRRDELVALKQKREQEQQIHGPWTPLANQLGRQVSVKQQELNTLVQRFEPSETLIVKFFSSWSIDSLKAANYTKTQGAVEKLSLSVNSLMTDLGSDPIKFETLPPSSALADVRTLPVKIELFPLFMSVVLDFLTVLLSFTLHTPHPEENINPVSLEALYREVLEFRVVTVNAANNYQMDIRRTREEVIEGYHDAPRLLACTTLLNMGYLRRVDRHHFEFIKPVYDFIVEALEEKARKSMSP